MRTVKAPGANGASGGRKLLLTVAEGAKDEEQSTVQRLFQNLGEGDRVKVYRLVGGKNVYCGTIEATPDLVDSLEERLVEMGGGGDYSVKGFHSGNNIACANISIDEKVFPRKASEAEGKRGDDPGRQQGPTALEIMELQRTAEERAENRAAERSARERETMTQMFGIMQAQAAATAAAAAQQTNLLMGILAPFLSRAAHPEAAAAPTAPRNQLAELKDGLVVLKDLQSLTGGGGEGGESEKRSIGMRLLEKPLESLADKAGERLLDQWLPKTAAPTPAAAPTATTATGAPTPTAPPPTSQIRLPPGAKLLSLEDVARARQGIRPATVAPRANDVLPKEPQAKEPPK